MSQKEQARDTEENEGAHRGRWRSKLLDELCEMRGYERKHAIKLLNGKLPIIGEARQRGGPRGRYGEPEKAALKEIWLAAEPWVCPSGHSCVVRRITSNTCSALTAFMRPRPAHEGEKRREPPANASEKGEAISIFGSLTPRLGVQNLSANSCFLRKSIYSACH